MRPRGRLRQQAPRDGVLPVLVLLAPLFFLAQFTGVVHASHAMRKGRLSPPWRIREPAANYNATLRQEATGCFTGPGGKATCGNLSSSSGFLPWRPEELKHAVLVPGLEQFGPLMRKLYARKPLHVLAIGSSVTHWQGGCFHTGAASEVHAQMRALSPPSWTVLFKESDPMHHQMSACRYLPYWSIGVGWLNGFMQGLNSSFPHARHALMNAGRTATKLGDFADVGCLEDHLPATVDLVVLENPASLSGGAKVEQLLWRLLRHYKGRQSQRPAVILLNSAYSTQNFAMPEVECLLDPVLCDSKCANRTFRHAFQGPGFYSPQDGELVALAHYWGLTLLSHRHFMYQAILTKAPTRLNTTLCHFMAAFFHDHVHLGPLGMPLFSHYLMHVLDSAEQLYLSTLPSTNSTARAANATARPPSPPRPSAAPAAAKRRSTMAAPPAPPTALFNGSWQTRDDRCPLLVEATKLPSPQVGEDMVHNGSAALVTRAQGWRFVEYQVDGKEGKSYRYKPGWVAQEAGARLQLLISTVMGKKGVVASSSLSAAAAPRAAQQQPAPASNNGTAEEPGGAPASTFLVVSYLTSYEHMGIARLACVSGCTCEAVDVDAHVPLGHTSLYATTFVTVSPSPRCEVELQVLASTNSGEHKWKLIGLTLSASAQTWSSDTDQGSLAG